MKNIITVQHTQSLHHTNGMIGAWTDWDLSEIGKKQADNIGIALAKEIKGSEYVLFSSDLKRAHQTAQAIAAHIHISPILKKEIREVDAGIYKPTPVTWFNENKVPQESKLYNPDYKPFPGAESDREL